jgi:hypothetical protein
MQYLSFNKLRHWQWSPTGSAIWEKALTFSTITQCIYDPQIRTTLEIFFACNPSHILSFATEIAWKLEIKMTPVVLVWSELLGYPTGCRRKQIACSFWHNLPILSICIMKQQFGHTCQHDVDQCDCREKVLHKNMVAGIACASYHEQWPKRACVHDQMMFSQPATLAIRHPNLIFLSTIRGKGKRSRDCKRAAEKQETGIKISSYSESAQKCDGNASCLIGEHNLPQHLLILVLWSKP